MRVYVCAFVRVCCVCMCVHVHVCMCACVCMGVHLCVCMCRFLEKGLPDRECLACKSIDGFCAVFRNGAVSQRSVEPRCAMTGSRTTLERHWKELGSQASRQPISWSAGQADDQSDDHPDSQMSWQSVRQTDVLAVSWTSLVLTRQNCMTEASISKNFSVIWRSTSTSLTSMTAVIIRA